jgi:hypothetical protein
MATVLQEVFAAELPWRRSLVEQGKALPGSWNTARGKMRSLRFSDAVLAECAVVRCSVQLQYDAKRWIAKAVMPEESFGPQNSTSCQNTRYGKSI